MPLINCKVKLSLTWHKNCILSSVADDSTFAIADTKLYVPIVTLKTEDNTKLLKLLSKGFKRPIYWNEYKVTPNKNYDANVYGKENDDATENSYRKYFLSRMKIKHYNIEIDGRNFYNQSINDSVKQYNKIKKYQQDRVIITQQVVYWIMFILKRILR